MADRVTGEVIPAADINNLRSGVDIAAASITNTHLSTSAITLGYAEITSNFTTTTVSSDVDVTNLSVTVTVPTGGRRCKITAYASGMMGSGGSPNLMYVSIKESSTVLQIAQTQALPNTRSNMCAIYSKVLSAGSHTYKVSVQQNNAGTLTMFADPTAPSFILVEAL